MDASQGPSRVDLLLVEDPAAALLALCLGWPAVAMLTRPQAHGPEDLEGTAAKMLEAKNTQFLPLI